MTKKTKKNTFKIAGAAVVACAACCAPIIGPFILGLLGVGVLGVGYWAIGGLVVLAAIGFAIWRRNQACDCTAPPKSRHGITDCCGAD